MSQTTETPKDENLEDLESRKKAFLDAVYGVGCLVLNSDVASDPNYERKIESRIKEVRNHCAANVIEELSENPGMSDSSRKFAEQLANKLLPK